MALYQEHYFGKNVAMQYIFQGIYIFFKFLHNCLPSFQSLKKCRAHGTYPSPKRVKDNVIYL